MARREIIDGQQRLTTLQIVRQAAKHAFADNLRNANPEAALAAQIEAGRLGQLMANPPSYIVEERYKVWPTNADRHAFQTIMDADGPAGLVGIQTRMAEAYRFFLGRMTTWLGEEQLSAHIRALSSALMDHLKLIVLDLDDADEPQAIFETLNAHGTPLLPADLTKNWLLWQFARNGSDGG